MMRLTDKSTLAGLCRGLGLAAAIGCVLVVGACGKRGPLENPQITTGVDENGEKITKPAPPPDYGNTSFILDPILF